MRLLVRTWNVFHGNASPPERRAFLGQMVRLAVADGPDVLCLQELPVWSLRRLEGWSGMTAVSDLTKRPLLRSAELGRMVTDLHHGVLRSAFTGQANAILVSHPLRMLEHRSIVLNPARERRLCQAVRLETERQTLFVANLHVDRRSADEEILRAAEFVEGFTAENEPIVLAGDFNVALGESSALRELAGPKWEFAGATPTGIDHVLARGMRGSPGAQWPVERRTVGGRVLSDHAPVDRELV